MYYSIYLSTLPVRNNPKTFTQNGSVLSGILVSIKSIRYNPLRSPAGPKKMAASPLAKASSVSHFMVLKFSRNNGRKVSRITFLPFQIQTQGNALSPAVYQTMSSSIRLIMVSISPLLMAAIKLLATSMVSFDC